MCAYTLEIIIKKKHQHKSKVSKSKKKSKEKNQHVREKYQQLCKGGMDHPSILMCIIVYYY